MKGRKGEEEGSSVKKKLSDPLPFPSLPHSFPRKAEEKKEKMTHSCFSELDRLLFPPSSGLGRAKVGLGLVGCRRERGGGGEGGHAS